MTGFESLYSLRYQVYCHEAHILNPCDYPDGLETDEFDPVSEHFISTNATNSNNIVGAIRLVRWTDALSFPTAEHFPSLLEKLECMKYPIDSTAEISRLCISKQFRRRAMDKLLGVESFSDGTDKRRKFPMIILELFKSIYLASKYELGITHWIATFEDCLYRLLTRYGVFFELLIPEEIDYFGKVKIYGASIAHIEEEMKNLRPELFGFFLDQSDN